MEAVIRFKENLNPYFVYEAVQVERKKGDYH